MRRTLGELQGSENRAAVRGLIVALKPGNAGGAKGPRKNDCLWLIAERLEDRYANVARLRGCLPEYML